MKIFDPYHVELVDENEAECFGHVWGKWEFSDFEPAVEARTHIRKCLSCSTVMNRLTTGTAESYFITSALPCEVKQDIKRTYDQIIARQAYLMNALNDIGESILELSEKY
jgi:hypothetical protein